jgi:predicted DNA-binding protein YlxM (UPF0122 family)
MVHSHNNKLTKTEQEVLEMYDVKKYSVNLISKRRGTTPRAVYKILRVLKQKGWLEKHGSQNTTPSITPISKRYYRLHNLHFIVTPYYFYDRFKKEVGKIVHYDKWVIKINSTTLEFQTKRKKSFNSTDINETSRLSRESIYKAIRYIENETGCEVLKDRKMNIELVNHHIAEVNNGIAKNLKNKKLEISDEQGVVWCIVDMSLNIPELETVHPKQATDDMRSLEKHFKSMRVPDSPTVTDLSRLLYAHTKNTEVYVENIKKHLSVLDKMEKTLEKIDKKLEGGPFLSRSSSGSGRSQHSRSSLLYYQ